MVGYSKYTKLEALSEDSHPRRKVVRFIENNKTAFSDYPTNKEYLIDREDLRNYNYYTTDLATNMFYLGGFLFISTGLGFYYLKTKIFTNMSSL